jgi:hypothetical protein
VKPLVVLPPQADATESAAARPRAVGTAGDGANPGSLVGSESKESLGSQTGGSLGSEFGESLQSLHGTGVARQRAHLKMK